MYFDTAYLAKLYIVEAGSDEVRSHAANADQLSCLAHGRVELAFMFHRKLREEAIDRHRLAQLWEQVEADERSGMLSWLPLTSQLLEASAQSAINLPAACFLRASDALHLLGAKEYGFREIFSNDTHLLKAAKLFSLKGRNVIG
ncbi:MAG: type II toxin-antitoxin system VapC family toxin [Chthoniobacterales bacterium]|nr:type II toxin-antitoxin system VapC family toxin [Chthoniobacterales bacterium]